MAKHNAALLLLLTVSAESFLSPQTDHGHVSFTHMSMTTTKEQQEASKQFKILTCSASSCAQKRKLLGMDAFATYGAFYGRIQEGLFPDVELEEVSCLGACKKAPCVAVQHEDFEGNVALEGMNDNEFSERVFHEVITEGDADRIWGAVENAIKQMAEEDDDDDDDNELDDDEFDESRFV